MATIFAIVSTVLLAALGLGLAWWAKRMEQKEGDAAQGAAAERAVLWERAKALVLEALPWLITEAERLLGGGGTGKIKRSMVISEAIKLIPSSIRGLVQNDVLIGWIEKALDEMKPLWNKVPALIAASETNIALHLVTNDISTTIVDAITNDATVTISAAVDGGNAGEAEASEILPEDAAAVEDGKAEAPSCDEYTAEVV